jgi:FkbM family methyltransferase
MKKLFKKLLHKNIAFSHVCEVGVFLPEYSNIIDFIKKGIRTTLVEADPITAAKIVTYFKDDNVIVHPVAIFDRNGQVELSRYDQSTFVTALKSTPAIINDRYKQNDADVFTTECRLFSEIDTGDIDLISIDIEGCEWYVIDKMISRPKIISVETHSKAYVNPNILLIETWMKDNSYKMWYQDLSDTVYVQSSLFKPGISDKFQTSYSRGRVKWKKFKQSVKKFKPNVNSLL